ncbi:phosphopantetheine-binding protein [Nonomuraea sp. NPDC000554]|uniref:phosphopantetheine-binding protein n=1 Tax=Nonomuraea sp. NPDC000554 TaxID=3154259 RepID=UPI003326D0F9
MSSESGSRLDRAELERRVTEIWRDVLGTRPGQDDATFFELSGQSIAAVRITARIEDEAGVLVDIGELFEDPDLPAFVAIVLAKAEAEGQPKLSA